MEILPAYLLLSNSCLLPRATAGVPYNTVMLPTGGYSPYTFQLFGSLPTGFALTPEGAVTGLATDTGAWIFKIATTDSHGNRAVNDCGLWVDPPAFKTSVCPLPGATTGVPYSVDLGGGFTWSVAGTLPGGLTLAPNGLLSGTPMVAGGAQFRLLATNAQGKQEGEACSLVVTRGPLGVTGCPVPDGRVGEPYAASVFGAGGSIPYLFSRVAGTLPAGLEFSPSGAIRGTPEAAGTFGFTLRLRDGLQSTVLHACQITVAPSELKISTACPLPDGYAGETYAQTILASGGKAPYQFSFGTLPTGLTGAATGAITGKPERTGSRNFSIRVSDTAGSATEQSCSLTVAAPRVPAVSIVDPPATVPSASSSLVLQVKLASAYSAPVKGQLVLTVTPNTGGKDPVVDSADPHLAFANGQRKAAFTIPAGQTTVNIPVVSTGSVAATVQISIEALEASGAPLVQFPSSKFFRIPPATPSITSACYVRTNTEEGVRLEFRITGFSNTRELKEARITIPGLADPTRRLIVPEEFVRESTDTIQVPTETIAFGFFASPLSVVTGGGFTLSIPAILEGDPAYLAPTALIQGAQIEVLNQVGGSGTQSVSVCP
jgi:hypothetical protein